MIDLRSLEASGSIHKEFISTSPQETEKIGETIATLLQPGSVVALNGGLGVGKTCLTRGIGRALKVAAPITSPTYTIINEYESPIPFYHIDVYRLQGQSDFYEIGGEEILSSNGISVIEWSEKINDILPPKTFFVDIKIQDDGTRKITFRALYTAANGNRFFQK
ncbi:MAG: tRNA (adenosine(37)-N6)-threonylcarbamoyltransferase complex ATPase subunit type 1 TsaE [Termitinemataceae bacterium]|nr:MAG: tRNA (adenosine(37)-N6)-threonylcarbamoyltransferase complex ATPase subunit type 1 TsaE [Termitinemataceae bacterium]